MKLDFSLSYAILAQKQSGKTNLILNILKKNKKLTRFFVYDFVGNYASYYKTIAIDEMEKCEENGIYRIASNLKDEHLEDFCKVALRLRTCCCVFDEISAIVNKSNLERYPWFKRLVLIGANYGVGSIFATQRYTLLNNSILANCALVFVGKTTLQNDLKRLENFFPKALIPQLSSLKYEFFVWDNGKISKMGKIPKLK